MPQHHTQRTTYYCLKDLSDIYNTLFCNPNIGLKATRLLPRALFSFKLRIRDSLYISTNLSFKSSQEVRKVIQMVKVHSKLEPAVL